MVVDTRSPAAFGAAHIANAYNMQLSSSQFEQRVGWSTPLDIPMILVVEEPKDAQRATYLMAFVGLDQRVKGFLSGGMAAWVDAGLPHKTLDQMSVHHLYEHLQDDDMKVLDVRDASEWDEGHILAAQHMSFKIIRQRMDELNFTKEDSVAIVCASGMRSSTAGSILLMNGFKHVYNVTGGMKAWQAAGLPMVNAEGVFCNL
jgi:hydroxyacylglutathione hydrolase